MARPKLLGTKFQMMMSDLEINQIDDWMFSQRLKSRADAIRRLCQLGIEADRLDNELTRSSDDTLGLFAKAMSEVEALIEQLNEAHGKEIEGAVSSFEPLTRKIQEVHLIARELKAVGKFVQSGLDPYRLSTELKNLHEIFALLRRALRVSYTAYDNANRASLSMFKALRSDPDAFSSAKVRETLERIIAAEGLDVSADEVLSELDANPADLDPSPPSGS